MEGIELQAWTQQTWANIVAAAQTDPVLLRMVRAVEYQNLTREQALIQVVLYQSVQLKAAQDRELQRLMLAPAAPIILCSSCPARAQIERSLARESSGKRGGS